MHLRVLSSSDENVVSFCLRETIQKAAGQAKGAVPRSSQRRLHISVGKSHLQVSTESDFMVNMNLSVFHFNYKTSVLLLEAF